LALPSGQPRADSSEVYTLSFPRSREDDLFSLEGTAGITLTKGIEGGSTVVFGGVSSEVLKTGL